MYTHASSISYTLTRLNVNVRAYSFSCEEHTFIFTYLTSIRESTACVSLICSSLHNPLTSNAEHVYSLFSQQIIRMHITRDNV